MNHGKILLEITAWLTKKSDYLELTTKWSITPYKSAAIAKFSHTHRQTTQAKPISMAKSSALVSSKLERSAMAKSLLVCTVIGDERVSGFSSLGFFGMSTPSLLSSFIC